MKITNIDSAAQLVILILGVCLLVMVLGGGLMNWQGKEVESRYYDTINSIVLGLIGLLAKVGASKDAKTDDKQEGH